VESWTATATIVIGTMPTLEGILGLSGAPAEPLEGAHELVTRIGAIQFQHAVFADARKARRERPGAFTGASLRGIIVDNSLVRLEASSASKEEALTLLQQSMLAIQAAHRKFFEPRMELLRSVRAGLENAKTLLNKSFEKGDSNPVPVRPAGASTGLEVVTSPGALVDKMMNVDTRIAFLNYLERTGRMTASQDEFPPVVEGPREVNLVQRSVWAGLGMLLFIGLLTLLLKRSEPPVRA
jgi:hypothetical protein